MRDWEQTRSFVVHLRAEHRRVREILRRIQDEWGTTGDKVPSTDQVAPLIEGLEELRENLARHFHEEEQGGCLEEAVCRCPSLSQKACEIEHEHPLLLEKLDRIIGRARRSSHDADAAQKTKGDFDGFARHLHAHEAAENQILASAFGTDAEELEIP